jgi:hypothetical protein
LSWSLPSEASWPGADTCRRAAKLAVIIWPETLKGPLHDGCPIVNIGGHVHGSLPENQLSNWWRSYASVATVSTYRAR